MSVCTVQGAGYSLNCVDSLSVQWKRRKEWGLAGGWSSARVGDGGRGVVLSLWRVILYWLVGH
jgi:hypothetical protein